MTRQDIGGFGRSETNVSAKDSRVERDSVLPADAGIPIFTIQPEVPAPIAHGAAEGSKARSGNIAGPSFLGLGDPDQAEDPNLTYLYDDNPPSGHGRFWIAALMTIALFGFLAYVWRENPELSKRVVSRANEIWHMRSGEAAAPAAPITAAQMPESASNGSQPGAATAPLNNQVAEAKTIAHEESKGNLAKVEESVPKPNDVAETSATAGKDKESATGEDEPKQAPRHAPNSSAAERAAAPGAALIAKADNYLYGRGVPKSCDQALVYLRTAADNGNTSARSKLGGLYATGNCVPLDRVRAYYWFSLARTAGDHNVWVDQNMSMLWSAMTAQEKARATPSR